MQSLRIIITGKVQGVYYRASTQAVARELELTGWVRNLDNGNVEVLAQGEKAALDKLLEWCRHGPPRAQVNHVEIDWQTAEVLIDNEFNIV